MTASPPIRVVDCPNCGSKTALHNPGIITVVCDNCRTLLLRQEDGFKPGETSLLVGALSGIGVGSTGRVAGIEVAVLGRVRCEGSQGPWNEWFVEDKTGEAYWLLEEEGRFKWEQAFDYEPPENLRRAPVGTETTIDDRIYQIVESGPAQVIGAEGQLPRGVVVGERFTYVDLATADGEHVVSLEISRGESGPTSQDSLAFRGQPLPRHAIDLSVSEAPPPTDTGQRIQCKSCGASVDKPLLAGRVQTLSCSYCGGVHELQGDVAVLLGKNSQQPAWALELGAKGTWEGQDYEVVGRTLYKDREFDDGAWVGATRSQEFLLLGADRSFATLALSSDGCSWLERQTSFPRHVSYNNSTWGASEEYDNRTFRMYEKGHSTLLAVEGALPWRARLNDQSEYADYLHLPGMWSTGEAVRLSLEWSKNQRAQEQECFIARHVSERQAQNAFSTLKWPTGLERSPIRRNRFKGGFPRFVLMLLLAGLCNLLASATVNSTAKPLGNIEFIGSLGANTSSKGQRHGSSTSKAFEVKEGTRFLRLNYSATVDNAWVSLDANLLRAEDGSFVGTTSQDVEYYHGVEDGESWSEGSNNGAEIFRAPAPGMYKLQVTVSGGEPAGRRVHVNASLSSIPWDTNVPKRFGIGLLILGLVLLILCFAMTRTPWDKEE